MGGSWPFVVQEGSTRVTLPNAQSPIEPHRSESCLVSGDLVTSYLPNSRLSYCLPTLNCNYPRNLSRKAPLHTVSLKGMFLALRSNTKGFARGSNARIKSSVISLFAVEHVYAGAGWNHKPCFVG
jgi:hypothetical protein